MMLVSLISYIDRNTLALLAPTILSETGLSAEQYGWVISAFSVAYMLRESGLGTCARPGRACARMLSAESMDGRVRLTCVRGGVLEFRGTACLARIRRGRHVPGGLRTAVQTLPPGLRSRGIAVAYSGGSLGAVATPIIVTPIAAAFGWRGAFWFTGAIGLLWVLWWSIVSRRPELRHRESVEPATEGSGISFRDAKLWSFMAIYALGGLPLAFVLYGSALYLGRVLGKSQIEIGHVLWIPPLGWEVGYFFWGWVTDRFAAHGTSIKLVRRLMLVLAVVGLPLGFTALTRSFPLTLLLMFLAMFASGGFVIASVASATYVFSSRNAGLIAGIAAGSWSALVAVFMPLFGALFDRGRYDLAFPIAAACPIIGVCCWMLPTARGSMPRATLERSI